MNIFRLCFHLGNLQKHTLIINPHPIRFIHMSSTSYSSANAFVANVIGNMNVVAAPSTIQTIVQSIQPVTQPALSINHVRKLEPKYRNEGSWRSWYSKNTRYQGHDSQDVGVRNILYCIHSRSLPMARLHRAQLLEKKLKNARVIAENQKNHLNKELASGSSGSSAVKKMNKTHQSFSSNSIPLHSCSSLKSRQRVNPSNDNGKQEVSVKYNRTFQLPHYVSIQQMNLFKKH